MTHARQAAERRDRAEFTESIRAWAIAILVASALFLWAGAAGLLLHAPRC
jgi:hypothetical protein